MATIYDMVNRKLNKHPITKRKVMPKKGRKSQVVVLRPSLRDRGRSYTKRHVTRKSTRGFLGGGLSSINGIKNTLAPYAMSLGMGTIGVAALTKFKPNASMQTAQMVGLAAEYIGGGVKGLIGAEVIKKLVGAPSLLDGGLFGGGQTNSMQMSTVGWA